MYHLPLTLETPGENLALDHALLDAAELGELPGAVLRVWEPARYFVVLGRSSAADKELRLDACRADGVPILRRISGGGAIVAGPGCLMYALVLTTDENMRQKDALKVDAIHRFVLNRLATALSDLAVGVRCEGTSDLVLQLAPNAPRRKFAGNSLRIARNYVLYHGSILYDFQLDRVARWLAMPARQPRYRQGRDHHDFLTNFPADRESLTTALTRVWNANEPLTDWPRDGVAELVETRYATPDWNLR